MASTAAQTGWQLGRTTSFDFLPCFTLPTFTRNPMNTFTITEKTLTTLPGMNLTRIEVEAIAQVFGLRVLDWRRFTDQQASAAQKRR